MFIAFGWQTIFGAIFELGDEQMMVFNYILDEVLVTCGYF